ncbi:hypothetical protein V8F33_001596 [Rhypophila sp. PSN 637]
MDDAMRWTMRRFSGPRCDGHVMQAGERASERATKIRRQINWVQCLVLIWGFGFFFSPFLVSGLLSFFFLILYYLPYWLYGIISIVCCFHSLSCLVVPTPRWERANFV